MRKTQKSQRWVFTVEHDRPGRDSAYHRLILRLIDRTQPYYLGPDLTVHWQANTGEPGWYGYEVKMKGHGAQHLQELAKAARILLPEGNNLDPQTLIEHLEDIGVFQAVHDDRVQSTNAHPSNFSQAYVTKYELLAEDLAVWSDDEERMGRRGPMMYVLGRSEEEAQSKLGEALWKDGYHDYLAKWIVADRPVRKHEYDRAPVWRDWQDIIAL